MIPESIHPRMKIGSIKYGDARVFGEDSDVRRKLGDEAAISRFEELWAAKLASEVENAPQITREQAEELLEEKMKSYAVDGYRYRQFLLHNVPFVARITGGGQCDQLWALGAHRDNTRLCVNFETIADRERFEEIAAKLGWHPRALGLRLLTDFMQKFDQSGSRSLQ
jgi:hypothetical protein